MLLEPLCETDICFLMREFETFIFSIFIFGFLNDSFFFFPLIHMNVFKLDQRFFCIYIINSGVFNWCY